MSMTRPIPLHHVSLESPLADFCEQTKITKYRLAQLDGVAPQTMSSHVDRGGGIGLDVLARIFEAAGYRLVIGYEPVESPKK